jgi:von Willebrand factor type A domain/Abnormal spindle-like microcephaly-assoc'd, ASPM-SPD-2-Hydin
MACTPFPALTPGLFENANQAVWNNTNETKGGRTVAYSGGTLTVTGPNGSTFFTPPPGGWVKHRFFGTGNYLAVLTNDGGVASQSRRMSIVDFVAASITSTVVVDVNVTPSTFLPWLQNSPGNGAACCVGSPTSFGVADLAIYRSDTAAIICAGPPPSTPSIQYIGDVTPAGMVQIQDGGTVVAGPCAVPAGSLDAIASQSFATVKVGGCPQPPSTRQFTLRNGGSDCLTLNGIAAAGPFSVTAQDKPFPAILAPTESMHVTVTFAPTTVTTFSNNLPINRAPANGADHLPCTGMSQAASAALTAPGLVGFGTVQVGTPVTRNVIITNSGDLPTSVSVAGSPPGSPFVWPAFSGPLNCGQSTTISVVFTPTAVGQAQATLSAVGSPGGTRNVTLDGTGCIPQAAIVVPPLPFPAFGDVRQGYREPRFITIRNSGNGHLTFDASISGPDASLFGLMRPSQSITDVVSPQTYGVDPIVACGGGATGDGAEEVVVVFFANAAPPQTANATLTISNHNDPAAPAAFSFPLVASIIAGNVVDVVAVFDTSGSMADLVQGGGSKMAAAIQAGRLLVGLLPPDLTNRVAGVRFSTDATVFLPIDEVTSANQAGKASTVADPPLTPNGWTAIAAGIMTGLPMLAGARPGPAPALLTKAAIVLTDGKDNTAYKNPADNLYYSIQGLQARDPANPNNMIATHAFVPPSDVKVFAIGLGIGQDIDTNQLAQLSTGAGGYYVVVDPTRPATTYELMKLYTQIYMDLIDTSVIVDPKFTINPGQKDVFEFDVLAGDVTGTVVVYDFDGLRLPFWLETPAGEVVDAAFAPPGFQLRTGFTETSRFLDFVLPWGEPKRYAGRWRLAVAYDRVCRGKPTSGQKQARKPVDVRVGNEVDANQDVTYELGFVGRDCGEPKNPVDYGFVIGVGSNFRLDAYLSPAPVNVGDPIRMTGVPSEAGLPVTGCTVTVDIIAPTGATWNGLVLADDGAHEDGDPNDGEYARVFANTQVAGSYTFRFRATGYSRDGEPVMREAVRSKYVEGTLKPPDGGHPDSHSDCCDKINAILLRQTKLLEGQRRK